MVVGRALAVLAALACLGAGGAERVFRVSEYGSLAKAVAASCTPVANSGQRCVGVVVVDGEFQTAGESICPSQQQATRCWGLHLRADAGGVGQGPPRTLANAGLRYVGPGGKGSSVLEIGGCQDCVIFPNGLSILADHDFGGPQPAAESCLKLSPSRRAKLLRNRIGPIHCQEASGAAISLAGVHGNDQAESNVFLGPSASRVGTCFELDNQQTQDTLILGGWCSAFDRGVVVRDGHLTTMELNLSSNRPGQTFYECSGCKKLIVRGGTWEMADDTATTLYTSSRRGRSQVRFQDVKVNIDDGPGDGSTHRFVHHHQGSLFAQLEINEFSPDPVIVDFRIDNTSGASTNLKYDLVVSEEHNGRGGTLTVDRSGVDRTNVTSSDGNTLYQTLQADFFDSDRDGKVDPGVLGSVRMDCRIVSP